MVGCFMGIQRKERIIFSVGDLGLCLSTAHIFFIARSQATFLCVYMWRRNFSKKLED
jgi:hypothetical protein